jgi:predicted nuclease of predicted toxin-antitoxin system
MRFLADAGVSPRTVDFVRRLGHEAVHVRTLGLQRAPDAELVHRARTDSSVILTFDLDCGEVLTLGVVDKPSVIIFRLKDERADSVNRRLSVVLSDRLAELESGALILIEDAMSRGNPLGACCIRLSSSISSRSASRRERCATVKACRDSSSRIDGVSARGVCGRSAIRHGRAEPPSLRAARAQQGICDWRPKAASNPANLFGPGSAGLGKGAGRYRRGGSHDARCASDSAPSGARRAASAARRTTRA